MNLLKLELKLVVILPIVLLVGFSVFQELQNAEATLLGDARIKEIIKIKGVYTADQASVDFVIHPPISNVNNTIVFASFAHTGESDHSDTFRSYKIVNNNTLRVWGEDTATGNIAEDVIFYIIEFKDATGINVQHVNFNLTASEPEGLKFIKIDPVNKSRSTVVYRGESHFADETTVGDEEMSRITLYNSTDISWFVSDTPNSGDQVNRMSVIDWGTPFHFVQHGNGTLAGTTTTISPPIDVQKNRTLLTVTYAYDGGLDQPADEMMIRATLNDNNPPDIVIQRDDGAGDILFSWELTTFPPNTVNITYENATLGGGTTSFSDTITQVRDFDKTLVFGTVGTPFGYGTAEMTSGTIGAIDRGQFTLILEDNDSVLLERGDGTGTAIIDYVVFEILEAEAPSQNPQGQNTLKRITQFKGEFTDGNPFQDFDFSPPITDPTKSLILMSFSNDIPTGAINSNEITKSWELIDLNTIRVMGTTDISASNIGTNFTATIIEFDSSSPIFAQRDEISYTQDMVNSEKVMRISPVNATGSALAYNGKSTSTGDPTFGQEEFARARLLNGTNWGYDVEEFQNEAEHRDLVGIVDFNQDDIFVQRGLVSLVSNNVTVSPPIDIIRNQTILLFSWMTNSGEFDEEPADASIMGTITTDSPPDILFSRDSTNDQMEIEWQVISLPDYFSTVQHGVHHQDTGVGNTTQSINTLTNSSRAFVIGTSAGLFGYGMGSSNSTESNHFDVSTAQLTLENSTAFRIERGETNAEFDVGWQVVEFLEVGTTFTQNITDTTTVTDNVDLEINKTAVDFSAIVDLETNMTLGIENSDSVVVIDNVDILRVILTDVGDNGTVTDVTEFNINKTLIDSSLVSDTVTITSIRNILLSDTVIANDPSIILKINSVIPPDSGAPASSGGGIPSGLPTFQRIVGLSITSEYFNIVPQDVVPSDFIIQTFGKDESTVSIKNIEPDQQFRDWFAFSSFPDPLEFETTVDNSRLVNDPARYKNIAVDDFTLNAPAISCEELDPFVTPVPCLDPVIYKVPMTFTFSKGGVEFKEKHFVTVDATLRDVQCDLFCIINDYLQENYWWLAGAIIISMMLYFFGGAIKSKRVRTIRRVDSRGFTSFDADKPRRKFKKGKR